MKELKKNILEEIERLEKRSEKVLTFTGVEEVQQGISYGMKAGAESLKSILSYIEECE